MLRFAAIAQSIAAVATYCRHHGAQSHLAGGLPRFPIGNHGGLPLPLAGGRDWEKLWHYRNFLSRQKLRQVGSKRTEESGGSQPACATKRFGGGE